MRLGQLQESGRSDHSTQEGMFWVLSIWEMKVLPGSNTVLLMRQPSGVAQLPAEI